MISCMQCLAEQGTPSFEPIIVDYFDEAIAYAECGAGHKTAQLLQGAKFEILLESAATALLEGFTLEACGTFSAALERFYEFALTVAADAYGMEPALYDKMFAGMARQSERQLGAFMLFHALAFGESYEPNPGIAPFRNGVIHKGKIPTPAEARKFATDVYATIVAGVVKLRARYAEHILTVTMRDLTMKRAKVPAGMQVATNSGPLFLSLSHAELEPDFAKALERFRTARTLLAGAVPALQAEYAKQANALRNGDAAE